jgi:outer membrane receptor protein involved in Fe transport
LTSDANFKLPAEGVQVGTVEVIAERPLVNKSATAAVRIVDNDFIATLPVRGVANIVSLQPGVVENNGNFYIRGARSDATGYVVDGVPATNSVFGGRAVSFNAESIEQIQVQAGGYSAEYGNAGGGLIFSQLRTGPEKWKVSILAETDNYTKQGTKSLGGYSYGYSDYTATLGGPIMSEKLRFFGSVQNTFFRDPDVRFWDGIDQTGIVTEPALTPLHNGSGNTAVDTIDLVYQAGNRIGGMSNQFNYVGTLLYNLGNFQVRASGSYSNRDSKATASIGNVLNAARTPVGQFTNAFGTVKLTHFITPTVNYEVSAFYTLRDDFATMDPYWRENVNAYGDSAKNAAIGYTYKSAYTPFDAYQIYGGDIAINQFGTPISGFDHQKEEKMGGRLDLSAQYKNHAFKLGGEYTGFTIRRFNPGNSLLRAQTVNSTTLSDAEKVVQLRTQGTGIDNYGFDVFGKETSADITKDGNVTDLGPRQPVEAAFYVQDKMELPDINLYIGLRYDYIDNGGITLVNPGSIIFDDVNKVMTSSSWKKSDAAQYVSPRIGFSFPVTDRTVFHAQFNKLVSSSQFRNSYLGLGRLYSHVKGGNYFTAVSGFGLRPERTSQYEIGFAQQISEVASFDMTAFYRDIQDQIQYQQIQPNPGASQQVYPTLVNGDYSTTKGLEFRVTLRRVERIQGQFNYTFSDAKGTGSNPQSLAGAVAASGQPGFIPKFVFPLNFNQVHSGSFIIDYRYGKGDGGPILQQLGANLIMAFNSGYSFTRLDIQTLSQTDARSRVPLEDIGASTTPWNFRLDIKLDKTVAIGPLNANIYIYVQNLLNLDNPFAVFSRTGDPKDDGYLATALGSSKISTYGQSFANLYQSVNGGYNANNFSSPRQIRVGTKLEF